MRTYIFACGGTGGHIFPALSVSEEIRARHPLARLLYVCGKKEIEDAIFGAARLPDGQARAENVVPIEIVPFRGAHSLIDPVFLWKMTSGFFQSLALLRRERPVLVMGFGGYVSFPVIAAAKTLGIPTMIHEQNVVPGKANRALAGCVDAVALSFSETREHWPRLRRSRVTGNPIRSAVERDCREEAMAYFGFSPDKKTLLVLGGSQGSESINTLFLDCLQHLAPSIRPLLQVLHLCGRMDPEASKTRCRQAGLGAQAFSFFDRMDLAYGAADLCLGRAGATFLAEVRTRNIPVLLVPYPFADGHQRANARLYEGLIQARVVEQKELDAVKLARLLEEMLEDLAGGVSARPAVSGGNANARKNLADYIESLAPMPAKKSLHFIGMGGIGMSGIARLYLALGHRVQGSDAKRNGLLSELELLGAKVFIGHDASYVQGVDTVVYSSSIPESHPERVAAKKGELQIWHRSEALAALCRGKFTIAVSGTHGKTTTTGLIGTMLQDAGRDPSVVVGGVVPTLGGNACWGRGEEMVLEADESDASFLNFSPDITVITNIEAEHLDHYENVDQIDTAFKDFLLRLSPRGAWFGCAEDARVAVLAAADQRAQTYGFHPTRATWTAAEIVEFPDGQRGSRFEVLKNGKKVGEITLRIPGKHNVLNALAAVGVGRQLGLTFEDIARALGRYEGAGRRFEMRYEDADFLVVDDYAHHPTEIRKTLEAARTLKKNRIVALFQPHRYSRTELLMRDFGKSFIDADKLIITDIYAASETPRPGISGKTLYEEVLKNGHRDASFAERGHLAQVAQDELRPGDLVLVMGAGDIHQVAGQLSESLRRRRNGANPFSSVRGRVLMEEPLSRHTTLKIGGPAQYWVEPADEKGLKMVLEAARSVSLPVHIFGAGSNLLAPDAGLRGLVLHLGSPYFKEIRTEKDFVVARAGVPNTLFIQYALQRGLGGCEFLLGIPGNIGGAIAMNAGSHGQWIAPIVRSVRTIGLDGKERSRSAGQIPFGYRHCGLKDEVILDATFSLPPADKETVRQRLEEYRKYRAGTQDLRYPSAGCMFKNPQTPGCSSGRLIDRAGLKGTRVGSAQVSEKHANFIVNTGGATAGEVRSLIEKVREAVKRKFDVELETEVKIL